MALPDALFPPGETGERGEASASASARLLVTGPAGSGKSSLLMQYAYSLAARGLTSLFVCSSPATLAARPPARPHLGSGASETEMLDRIKIKYVSTEHDLHELLAALHLCAHPPHALLIDDLAELCTSASAASDADLTSPRSAKAQCAASGRAAACVALAAHAADWIDAAHAPPAEGAAGAVSERRHPALLVACATPTPIDTTLLSRWLPARLDVAEQPSSARCGYAADYWAGRPAEAPPWRLAYKHDGGGLALLAAEEQHAPTPGPSLSI